MELLLPSVLVTLDTICIVDVTGIEDSYLLLRTLLATLWEYEYSRGDPRIVFYSDPDRSTDLSSEDLFNLCLKCAGSLKLFPGPRRPKHSPPQAPPRIYPSLPWYAAPNVVANLFSRYEKKFICTVHLAGAETVGLILDRIVKELQCHHYYLPIGGTWTTSENRPDECGPRSGSAADFYGHFRKDIGPDGSLKLYVGCYQARAAKRTIKQQPDINDLNIAGQVLPRIVVTIVACRKVVCTIVLTGIGNPSVIRQRIINALRFYGYLIQPDIVITQTDCSTEMTYEPLTDNGLFSLCREQGDIDGSLKLFVETPTLVYAAEHVPLPIHPLPKIIISVLDWDNQQPYFDMDVTGKKSLGVYGSLCTQLNKYGKLLSIYGDTWCSLDSTHLFRLIRDKGTSTGSLELFVALKPKESEPSFTQTPQPAGPNYYHLGP